MYIVLSMSFCMILGHLFICHCYNKKIGHTVRVSDVEVLAEDYKKEKNDPFNGRDFHYYFFVGCFV